MSQKMNELKLLENNELAKRLTELKAELMKVNTQIARRTIAKPHQAKEIKKNISRILTLLKAREKDLKKKGGK